MQEWNVELRIFIGAVLATRERIANAHPDRSSRRSSVAARRRLNSPFSRGKDTNTEQVSGRVGSSEVR